MTYVVITLVVLLILNIYCSIACQNLFYESKKSSMIEKCLLASDEISTLEVLNSSTVTGIVNQLIVAMGGEATNFMGNASYFRGLYVWTGVWQTMGYSAIVYLAALTGVPMDLYEAAKVDGASKLRRILSIDLPYIAPTIITLFILNTGSILSIGFEKVYLMQNSINTPVSEVISTYVYKIGVLQFSYSYSTAVGLFNSVVNLVMLLIVNTVSDRIGKVSVL